MDRRNSRALTIGIDEAGRGCVLGSLVVAVVSADESDRRWFCKHKVRDSKIVPGPEREYLAQAIRERCWFQVKIATALEIDAAVRDRSRTLNGLELEMMSDCLRDFNDEHGDREAFATVDAPSFNAHNFLEKLYIASGWGDMTTLSAKHHADERDRTVAAASLIAKSERERLIAKLKTELGCDFGSGYCHDERTIAHLKNVTPKARHVRWSWTTATRTL